MSSGEKAAKGKAKASSKTKSSKGKEASVNDQRFRGDGVKFKCKLVGSMDVSGARGDAMCAEAIKTLRLQALKSHKESGEHKQRIVIYVTLKGIRIVDEKTQKVQHEHPINKISFITHDPEDKRTFGYVCSQPCTTGHKLYAIKSEKPAGVITGTLYELFQVVFKIRQEAGLAKKVQNSSQAQNSPQVSNGPSVGGPQNSDGIYEVPYKNGNNKQPKPSPNLDHEYAEPIKPSTKSDPHYKVPNSPSLSATQSPQISDNSRARADVNDKLALKSISNSSPLLNRLQSFDKEPDQVSQASVPDSPFPARDNSSADLTFFSSSVFDTAPSESGMADTVSVASSADVSMLRSDSISSNSSDTRSTHSRSNSINQTATTEGSQPGFATTFDDASNVVTKVGEPGQVSESESQGDCTVAFSSLHGKEEPDEQGKVELSTGQETPVDNPDPFASSAGSFDPFASSTNDSERTQPGTSEGFFAESFAVFDSAFGDFSEKNGNGDNQVKEDFSSNDPFVRSSVVPKGEVATESSNDFTSETNFAAAFSSDKFSPSHPVTDVIPDDTESGTNESPVEEKSKSVENLGSSFSWDNSFQESESQADVMQKPLEDRSQLPEKLSGSFTWDNGFGNTSQSVTTESACTSEAVQFAWTESFISDDSDVTTKPDPSAAASISWDDAFGAAPAADESTDQPQNDFSWDNAFVIAFSSSAVVEDSSDKAGLVDSGSKPVPQPAAHDNPPAFRESAFTTSSSSQITESISDSLEANEPPPAVKDPFEEFKISFPSQTTIPEIMMSDDTGGEQSATNENLPNEELHQNVKNVVSFEETDKTVSQAQDLESESNVKNDTEEEQMKEERPCELQVQESKLSLSERPVSPTAPPPLPPRPSVSAPPLPARPSSSPAVSSGKPMSPDVFTESPSSTSAHQGKKGSSKKTPPPPPPRVDLNEESEVVSSNKKAAFPDLFGSDLFENSNDVSDHKTSEWTASWQHSPELPPKEKPKDPFSDSFFTDFDFPEKPGISKAANDHVETFATTNSSSDPFPAAFGNEDLFPAFTPAKADVAFGGGDPFQTDMSGSFSAFPSSDPFSDISDPFADKGILSDDPFGDSPSAPHVGESLTLNESLVASDEADSFA